MAAVAIAVLAAGVLALASLLWPQSQSSYALHVEPPEQRLAVRAFAVQDVRGWLVRQRDGRLDAFWARSPDRDADRGCAVELVEAGDPRLERVPPPFAGEPGGFLDPCGGSRWLLSGERVFGPAPRGLDRFPLAEGDSALLIDLGRVLLGACVDSASAERSGGRCSDRGLPVVESGPLR